MLLSGSGAAGAWHAGAVGCPWAQQAGSGGWGGIGVAHCNDSLAKFQGALMRFQRHAPDSS